MSTGLYDLADHELPLYRDFLLPLLATPRFKTGKTDPFTQEASHMTLSQNSLIRAFNSIYQQAPRLGIGSYKDFIQYCLAWHRCVRQHHEYEEVHFFPAIEEATGQKGVMDGEIEQNAAFSEGLDKSRDYLTELTFMEEELDHKRLLDIMDSFSKPLHDHLAAEPEALLALSRFSTPENHFDIAQIARETGKKAVTLDFALNVLPIFLLNMESAEFEDGMWKDFPEVPVPVRYIMRNVLPLWQNRWWRFTSCTSDGRRKQLAE